MVLVAESDIYYYFQVSTMRQEVSDLEKSLENRHTDVTDKDLVLSVDQMDTCQPVNMHGYLFKRTTNAFKTWNRRYFTLQNNQLVYRKRSGLCFLCLFLLFLMLTFFFSILSMWFYLFNLNIHLNIIQVQDSLSLREHVPKAFCN